MDCNEWLSIMMTAKEKLNRAATDFKNLLIDNLNSDSNDLSVSDVARAIGLDPSTMNRYFNPGKSNLPSYLIPFMSEHQQIALLHYLDNQCGNPLKGHIDTSDLNGSTRDECDMIVEALGSIIHLRRTESGAKSDYAVTELFQKIRECALRGEQEVCNCG